MHCNSLKNRRCRSILCRRAVFVAPFTSWDDVLGEKNQSGKKRCRDAKEDEEEKGEERTALLAPKAPDRLEEWRECAEACRGASLIVFNLFALAGWHIAESLSVPSVALSPYLFASSPPHWFKSCFRNERPQLYKLLRQAPVGRVGWGELEHWMWPLFAEEWDPFRALLGLPAPLQDDTLPPATPLVYGMSPAVCPPPGYWPSSVHLTGFWFIAHSTPLPPELSRFLDEGPAPLYLGFGSMGELSLLEPSLQCGLLAAVCRVALKLRLRLVVMESSFNVLRAVKTSGGDTDIKGTDDGNNNNNNNKHKGSNDEPVGTREEEQECVGRTSKPRDNEEEETDDNDDAGCIAEMWKLKDEMAQNLLMVRGGVNHSLLFPKCKAIVHHGGSGTTAAAVRAGVPQVICPLMADQSFWADQMHHLGVAPTPIHMRRFDAAVTERTLAAACQSESLAAAASELAATVRAEPDGALEASRIIAEHVPKAE